MGLSNAYGVLAVAITVIDILLDNHEKLQQYYINRQRQSRERPTLKIHAGAVKVHRSVERHGVLKQRRSRRALQMPLQRNECVGSASQNRALDV